MKKYIPNHFIYAQQQEIELDSTKHKYLTIVLNNNYVLSKQLYFWVKGPILSDQIINNNSGPLLQLSGV